MELLATTQAYLNTVMTAYSSVLDLTNDKNVIFPWLPKTIPDNNLQFADDDTVEVIKTKVLDYIKNILVSSLDPSIKNPTAWDFADNRTFECLRLFGPNTDKLPVNVVIGPSSFTHEVTFELFAGMMLALKGNESIKLFLFGEKAEESLVDRFLTDDKNTGFTNYKGMVNGVPVVFTSPQFIQGAITVANWMNMDSHLVIKDLNEFVAPDSSKELEF